MTPVGQSDDGPNSPVETSQDGHIDFAGQVQRNHHAAQSGSYKDHVSRFYRNFPRRWARAGASFIPSPTLATQKGPSGEAGQRPNHLHWEAPTLPAVNSPWRPFLREVARFHVAWLDAD